MLARSGTILVVEDEFDVREFVTTVLRLAGHTVTEADSLRQAQVILEEQRFDLIVTDISLGDGDGLALLPTIAAKHPATRVIVFTGNATCENAVTALRAGAYDFLSKPVSAETVRSAAARAVEAKRLEEQNALLLCRLADKVEGLKRMLDVTREVSGSLDLSVVLSRALDRTLELLEAEAGSILLRDEFSDGLSFAVVRGGPDPEKLIGKRLAAGAGIGGWVVEHRRPLVVNDARKDPRFSPTMDEISGLRTRRVLACPLVVKQRVIGVLEVVNSTGKFTRAHRIATETLAFSIAAAIENARITSNLQKSQQMLVEQSEQLERRVYERTAELRESNESLAEAVKHLAETRDQMVRAEKMASVGCIAAGVAHEINNPIGFINSNLQTLRGYVTELSPLIGELRRIAPSDAEIDERIRRFDLDFVLRDLDNLVRESEDGVQRVVKIVKDLKTFSHADRGAPEETDVNACVESAVNLARNETKYVADVTMDLGALPKVRAWPGQVTQVAMNLLVNAAHAVAERGIERGSIRVRTRAAAESVILEVVDDGCGIPLAIANRVFDPFFTTKDPGRGTGLGLSLSYEIVKRHEGAISFQSIPGETTFVVELPLLGPDHRSQNRDATSRQIPETGRRGIEMEKVQ